MLIRAVKSSPDGCLVCRWPLQMKILHSAPTYLPHWTSWWLWFIPFLVSDDLEINKRTLSTFTTVNAFFICGLRLWGCAFAAQTGVFVPPVLQTSICRTQAGLTVSEGKSVVWFLIEGLGSLVISSYPATFYTKYDVKKKKKRQLTTQGCL